MDASWKCPGNKEKWKSPVVEPFPLELTCNERYSKNRRKLQFSLLRSSWFFLPSIKIAQLVSDIKQHHMTNTYHNDYGCCLRQFSVQSIDNDSFIHSGAFARESVCLFTRHAVTNSWKRRRGGKLWAVMLPVVWFTKSSQWHKYRTCVLLVRVKYFWDILMKQVVGWYLLSLGRLLSLNTIILLSADTPGGACAPGYYFVTVDDIPFTDVLQITDLSNLGLDIYIVLFLFVLSKCL